MNKARSIKQNALPDALPNFRNLGVTLRILLIGGALTLLQAVLLAHDWADLLPRMMQAAALFAPVMLACLLLLWAAQPWLKRLAYWHGVLAIGTLAAAVTLLVYYLGGEAYRMPGRNDAGFDVARHLLFSVLTSTLMLTYFRWRSQTLSRALHDARLQALRARIRPHFLFNSINAVLSIVRTRPQQAENALEDMSDLFRMAMTDAHDLVPLHREVELGRSYLALEQLRLGERLGVEWQIREAPGDALIPPLLLQPLLENAVYHGIEPLLHGGTITVALRRSGDKLRLVVENPCAPERFAPHEGNKMALQNIRERLALLFDVEARYKVESGPEFYRVEITLPYLKEQTT